MVRLSDARYSQSVLLRALMFIQAKLLSPTPEFVKPHVNRVVIPYIHAVSHNLLHVAKKFNISLVFRNNYRLDALTPFTKPIASCKIISGSLFAVNQMLCMKFPSNVVFVTLARASVV